MLDVPGRTSGKPRWASSSDAGRGGTLSAHDRDRDVKASAAEAALRSRAPASEISLGLRRPITPQRFARRKAAKSVPSALGPRPKQDRQHSLRGGPRLLICIARTRADVQFERPFARVSIPPGSVGELEGSGCVATVTARLSLGLVQL